MNNERVMKELFKYYGQSYNKEPEIKSVANIMYDIGIGKEILNGEDDNNENSRIKNIG